VTVFSERFVEKLALAWFESAFYHIRRGAEISPGAEPGGRLRESYEEVVLEPRLRAALRRINDQLPEDAIEQAVRVVTRPPEPTLAQNNRWFHRLLTDGIDVEYRTADGDTRGDKAWLVDFAKTSRNDFLAVSQLIVQRGNVTRRPPTWWRSSTASRSRSSSSRTRPTNGRGHGRRTGSPRTTGSRSRSSSSTTS
jgi:type I restriction enzyme R subunit